MANEPRYPLAWPAGWARATRREMSRFRNGGYGSSGSQLLTLATGIRRLTDELQRLGARDIVISTDVPIRRDGMPYASAALPKDPGCAVYFTLRKRPMALACDKYTRLPDNMAALAAHIAALRAIERYGVGTVEQTFAGYAALPAQGQTGRRNAWHEVLDLDPNIASAATIESAYRREAKRWHPDLPGGSHEKMADLNWARAEGLATVVRPCGAD